MVVAGEEIPADEGTKRQPKTTIIIALCFYPNLVVVGVVYPRFRGRSTQHVAEVK